MESSEDLFSVAVSIILKNDRLDRLVEFGQRQLWNDRLQSDVAIVQRIGVVVGILLVRLDWYVQFRSRFAPNSFASCSTSTNYQILKALFHHLIILIFNEVQKKQKKNNLAVAGRGFSSK